MKYDILLVIALLIIISKVLIERIVSDIRKNKLDKKRFHKEENYMSKIIKIKGIYGVLTTQICICIIYIYLRLSGKL